MKMIEEITYHHGILVKEYKSLKEFENEFLNEYSTHNNQRYKLTSKMLSKIRSSLKKTKDIFLTYCPPKHASIRKYNLYGVNRPSYFESSYICTSTYSVDIFGIENYPGCVKKLLNAMKEFFTNLVNCLRFCESIIIKEEEIRKDHNYCGFLAEKCRRKMLKEIEGIMNFILANKTKVNNNPVMDFRKKCEKDKDDFASQAYHKYYPEEMAEYYAIDDLTKIGSIDENGNVKVRLCDSWEKEEQMTYFMRHLDSYYPSDTPKKKLDGKHMYWLYEYFCPYIPLTTFVSRFQEEYNKEEHSMQCLKYSGVVNAKDKLLYKNADKEREAFLRWVEQIANNLSSISA